MDTAVCREVSQSAERLVTIVFDNDANAAIISWIHAAEDVQEVNEEMVAEASPSLRQQVWDLIDAADSVINHDWSARQGNKEVDAMANAVVALEQTCTEVGYGLT